MSEYNMCSDSLVGAETSKMDANIDFDTSEAFCWNLTNHVFAWMEKRSAASLRDTLSQSICQDDKLLGFPANATVLKHLDKWRQHPPSTLPSVHTRGRRALCSGKRGFHGEKTCVLPDLFTAVAQATPQTTCRQASHHQSLINDSHWVPCRFSHRCCVFASPT